MTQTQVLTELEARLRSLHVERTEVPAYTRLALPAAEGAEFQFNLYVYDDGEPQISTKPMPGLASGISVDELAFWSLPFEEPDYDNHAERLAAFLAALEMLLTRPVRITQRRGWFWYRFSCDYQLGDRWIPVPGCQYFRHSNFKFLDDRRRERERTFLSPPLLRPEEFRPSVGGAP